MYARVTLCQNYFDHTHLPPSLFSNSFYSWTDQLSPPDSHGRDTACSQTLSEIRLSTDSAYLSTHSCSSDPPPPCHTRASTPQKPARTLNLERIADTLVSHPRSTYCIHFIPTRAELSLITTHGYARTRSILHIQASDPPERLYGVIHGRMYKDRLRRVGDVVRPAYRRR